MRYAEASGKAFSKKSDYVNSIVRACARKYLSLYYCASRCEVAGFKMTSTLIFYDVI